jgi:hypothetical protein
VIAAFEQKLAEVLGARMPVPFRGRVNPPPLPNASDNPDVMVGVVQADLVEPDFGSRRPEIAPGVADPRRVMRLRCTVGVRVRAGGNGGRTQQVAGIDAAMFILDAPDFRDGSALQNGGDPGFLIQQMALVRGDSSIDPEEPESPPFGLTLVADGWFWPAGTPGQAGVQIADIRVRGAQLPISVSPASPELVAGGPSAELTITIGGFGTMQERGAQAPLSTLPFGNLALYVEAPGGKPGVGVLSGGAAGQLGVRLTPVSNGQATVTYAPPATAAFEELVISLEGEHGVAGIELGRFGLRTR